jgi:ABC-type multidrug transport system fused ATPase/permease subunit
MEDEDRLFQKMGSQDDEQVNVSGKEFFEILKFSKLKLFSFALFTSIAGGTTPILMGLFMGDITGSMIFSSDFMSSMGDFVLKMGIVIIGMSVIMGMNYYTRSYAKPKLTAYLKNKLYSSIIEQEIDFFDQTKTGILVSRLSEDVTYVTECYYDKLLQFAESMINVIMGIIFTVISSWLIFVIVLALSPILFIIYYIGERMIKKHNQDFFSSSSDCVGHAEEIITQFRIVKSFDAEKKESKN